MRTDINQQALASVAEPGPRVPELRRLLMPALRYLHCRPKEGMAGLGCRRPGGARCSTGNQELPRVDWLPRLAPADCARRGLQRQVPVAGTPAALGVPHVLIEAATLVGQLFGVGPP